MRRPSPCLPGSLLLQLGKKPSRSTPRTNPLLLQLLLTAENAIVRENRREGDPSWLSQPHPPAAPGELEAYAAQVSALPGQRVALHASASPPAEARWVLRRLGWYGGTRARRLSEGSAGHLQAQAPCPPDFLSVGHDEYWSAASGALVFASGTIEWSYGLGKEETEDWRVQRMTAKLLSEAIGLPLPPGLREDPPSPRPLLLPWSRRIQRVASGLGTPAGVAFAPKQTLYVSDPSSDRIFRIPKGGDVELLAGGGKAEEGAADGVPGAQASFRGPTSLLLVGERLIVADTLNHCLRVIDLRAPGAPVRILAGKVGARGMQDGETAKARFYLPQGLAWDARLQLIVVADTGNRLQRGIDPESGATHTIAGGGYEPRDGPGRSTAFAWPTAVAASPDGRLFVVDTLYGMVRAIETDTERSVTTLPGGSLGLPRDGDGDRARIAGQGGALWDGEALLISEPAHQRLRRVLPGRGPADTQVQTLTDEAGEVLRLRLPLGLARGEGGAVYVSEAGGGAIRRLR